MHIDDIILLVLISVAGVSLLKYIVYDFLSE